MACFHIRWFDSTLDWECHDTQADAELVAQELARLEEGFTIEKYQDGEATLPVSAKKQRALVLGSIESALTLFGA